MVLGSNPGGGEIFRSRPDRSWGPPSLLYNGFQVPEKSGRGVMLTPHPLLVPWSRKSKTIPLLPLRTVGPVQSLSACTGCTFYFIRMSKGKKGTVTGHRTEEVTTDRRRYMTSVINKIKKSYQNAVPIILTENNPHRVFHPFMAILRRNSIILTSMY
jgi:hypothetical protein